MKRILMLMGVLLFMSASLFGQTIRITGTVTNQADGTSLPGVTVMVRGTTVGTITDANGRYEINAAGNATLVFSFVGMRSAEVPVEGRAVINMALEPEAIAIDEFVIVGYGIQQRRDVSGAIATIRGDELRTIPVQTFEQTLQGQAAGVNVTIPNAVLGNPPVIRVRGTNSISGSSSPLVVIDGVPVFTGDLSRTAAALNVLGDLNPADIASIEILKDASATAIYGSRAANGVMLITTRRGQAGRVTVNYDASFGWSSPYRLYELMNAGQFVATKNLARENVPVARRAALLGPGAPVIAYFLNYDENGNVIDTDWNDYVYQTGFQQSHSLGISGGTQETRYFLSLGYSTNEGIIRTNTMERMNARLNLDHQLNDWITLGASVNYTNMFTNAPQTGSLAGANFATAGAGRLAFVTAPNVPAFLPDGTYNIDWANNRMGLLTGVPGFTANAAAVGFFHPGWLNEMNYNNAQSDRVLANLHANVEIIDNLVFRTQFGLDNSKIESKTFWHPDHGDGRTNGGEAFNFFDRRNRWNWTNTLNYNASLFADRFNIGALVGSEEQYSHFDGWSGRRIGFADVVADSYQGNFTTPMQPTVSMLFENYFVSFFSRLNMNWDRRYYFEVSARRDGFSGLADGRKFGNFGGASAMWNISNEPFFQASALGNIFSDLRIKGSFGRVGNISGVGSYAAMFLYGSGVYNAAPGMFFSQLGNPDLGWETSNKYDLGLAFGLFNDRIQVDLNYFQNDIDGLILNLPQAPSKGIPGNAIPMNIGSMMNTGVELTVNTFNINTPDFTWNTSFNISHIRNEVTSLADGVPFLLGITHLETTNRTVIGQPIGSLWGVQTAGVHPATGRRIFIRRNTDGTTTQVVYDHGPAAADRWMELDANGAVTTIRSRAINITDDGVTLGSPHPRFFGGMDNTFTFLGFDLGIGLTYAIDFYVYNGSRAGLRDQRNWNNEAHVALNHWRNPGDITDIPRPVWGDNVSNGSSMVLDVNVERADFLKIRNLSLGYTLRNELLQRANISSMRFYAQVFNAFTFTNYSGADPEISSMGDTNLAPGVDRNTVPQARTIAFGVNVTF
ncbi:MAG TPA: TonB-dependent receptor [Bacteroidales bacterium]|nr:TonB-dependent receptor [Bacteroidales bacterium]